MFINFYWIQQCTSWLLLWCTHQAHRVRGTSWGMEWSIVFLTQSPILALWTQRIWNSEHLLLLWWLLFWVSWVDCHCRYFLQSSRWYFWVLLRLCCCFTIERRGQQLIHGAALSKPGHSLDSHDLRHLCCRMGYLKYRWSLLALLRLKQCIAIIICLLL